MALTQAVVSQEQDKVRDEVMAAVRDYLQNKGAKPTS